MNEKDSVINFAVGYLVPMHTLSFKKELLHGGYPSLAPHRASIDKEPVVLSGTDCYLRSNQGQANRRGSVLRYLRRMMPCANEEVKSLFVRIETVTRSVTQ